MSLENCILVVFEVEGKILDSVVSLKMLDVSD
jgi:hypothetical protein